MLLALIAVRIVGEMRRLFRMAECDPDLFAYVGVVAHAA